MPGHGQHWWVEVVDCDGEPLLALVGCWAIVGIEGAGGRFSRVVSHIVVCSCQCMGHCCTIIWLLLSLSSVGGSG